MQRYSGFGLVKHALSHHENWERQWRNPTPKKQYDVIIVGGGGHGLATAYYLAKVHGIKNVAVIEKGWLGGGNTARNTTIVRSNYLWDEAAALYEHSMKLWEGLSQDLNYNVMFSQRGVLNLGHTLQDMRDIQRRVNANRLNGIDGEVLDAKGVQEIVPILDCSKNARYPVLGASWQPRAGVARARRSCEVVAEAFRQKGGKIVIARASLGPSAGGNLQHLPLDTGEMLTADQYVFACGPWLPKVLPEVMADRLRTPLGRVVYFGTPVGDERFIYPHLPSFNFPGVTGWPALGVDNRGFRVRGGSRRQNAQGGQPGGPTQAGAQDSSSARGPGTAAGDRPADPPRPPVPPEQMDPDLSNRWVPPESLEGPRLFLAERFPALKDAPIVQTHACHYESSVDRNPIVDHYPGLDNVWIAGGGSAEGFKLGPVIGEYVARRLLHQKTDPEWDQAFKLDEEKFQPNQTFDDR